MPTGVQLSQLVSNLRSELGHSTNTAHGVNTKANMEYVLRRNQEVLYEEHDWPFLTLDVDVTVLLGQRIYNYPSNLPFGAINAAWWVEGNQYLPMTFGVSVEDFNLYDPDLDERSNPVQKWRHRPDTDQIELWPIPSINGKVRLRGTSPLTALIADSDICTLDSNLIVLHSAAELLARQKSEDASLKAQLARSHLTKLLSNQGGQKRKPWVMGGGQRGSTLRPGIDYIPMRG